MNTTDALFESNVPGLELLGRGKVRDIYAVDDDHLLIVTSDRLSAYDVVMPSPIPGKGRVLTQISLFWFGMMADLVPNQLTDLSVDDVVSDAGVAAALRERSLVVKRLTPLPIEAVVRGYLIGSGWKDYQQSGSVCGIQLPAGLQLAHLNFLWRGKYLLENSRSVSTVPLGRHALGTMCMIPFPVTVLPDSAFVRAFVKPASYGGEVSQT